MWRFVVLKLCFAVYLMWGAWGWWSGRPIHRADGVLAPLDPVQLQAEGAPVRLANWTLTPRASYRVTARILAAERYHFDRLASLIPEDLALGWGPMSDNRVLKAVAISQSNRFYFWHIAANSPIDPGTIISHSANTHVIPDGALTARLLARLRPGAVVTLTGELVDAQRDDGSFVHTSLSRTDTGAGACEVLLVHDVTVDP